MPTAAGIGVRALAVGAAWVTAYLGLVLAPLVVLIAGPRPMGLGFWWDLSMALGFGGLAMMSVQFVLTARFRRATAPFGIDVIYDVHRYLGGAALGVVLAHPIMAMADNTAIVGYLDPRTAPSHMTAGVWSLVALVALIVLSVARRRLGMSYESWRITHAILAVAAVGLACVHIYGVQYYMSMPQNAALWLVVLISCGAVVAFVRGIRPWQVQRRPYRVVSVVPERGDAWTVAVEPVRGSPLAFQPGQFAWLTLGRSPFAMREHPFSFSSSPGRPTGRLEFTIKELGDFTNTVGTMPIGTRAFVDGPYGAFALDRHPADRYVFLAGGIGVAPFLSMLKAMADRQDRRPVLLFYAYSRWDRMTCREELEALTERLNVTVVYVVDDPPTGWIGERGRITRELLARHLPERVQDAEYFLCGPPAMIRSTERLLGDLGVSWARVHAELFEFV